MIAGNKPKAHDHLKALLEERGYEVQFENQLKSKS